MAYLHASRPARFTPSLFSAFMEALRVAVARQRLFVQTLAELRQLSDRDLGDLGIDRGDITRLARETAFGRAH